MNISFKVSTFTYWLGGVILSLIIGHSAIVVALNPKRSIKQYKYDIWQAKQGLTESIVNSIAQTPDGYLWLGTYNGLIRFDGLNFISIDQAALSSAGVWYLYVDREGSLWICTYGKGLTRLKDNRFITYSTADGLPDNGIRTIYEDKEGALWVGTIEYGLSRFKDGKFINYSKKDGLPSNKIKTIIEDIEGNIWIGTHEGGLSKYKDGSFINYSERDGLPDNNVTSLFVGYDGTIWIATLNGLASYKDKTFTRYSSKDGLTSNRIFSVFEDSDKNLWIGTEGGGLNLLRDGKFSNFTTRDGLISEDLKYFYEDKEGSLWFGTNGGGLNRLSDGKFDLYTIKDGLGSNTVKTVYQDSSGTLWFGTINGLTRIQDGKVTTYTTNDGLSSNFITSIFEDRKGTLWVGTHSGGLNQFKNGLFKAYYQDDNLAHNIVSSIIEDRDGSLWVGTEDGLSRLENGKFTTYTTEDGLSNNKIRALCIAHDGTLWIGTGSRLTLYKNGKFMAYPPRGILANNTITAIYEDQDRVIWIGTKGGLVRYKDDVFNTYTTLNGLVDNRILQILDIDNYLWVSSDKGVSRIDKRELDELSRGERKSIKPFFIEREEGMGSSKFTLINQPSGWKTKDNRLLFATLMGAVVIDPLAIELNKQVPPVLIDSFIVDKERIDLTEDIELQPGRVNFEIHYTALSFLEPERVSFKYKLEGFDKDWVDAGSRRVAYYTNLVPGTYRFRVIGANNDGIWNEVGSSVNFYLKPHFYETRWFYSLCVISLCLAVWGAYRLRVKQINIAFSSTLSERTRIAREIHDTLLQDIAGIALQIKTTSLLLTQSPETARQMLDQILNQVNNCLTEGRRALWNLRSQSLETESLVTALRKSVAQLTANSSVKVEMQVHGKPRNLPSVVETNLLRIGQEAVTNVVKHAQASNLWIDLTFDNQGLLLSFKDDGHGMSGLSELPKEESGFGLIGMRERVKQLGGQIVVHSDLHRGTEIVIAIPVG